MCGIVAGINTNKSIDLIDMIFMGLKMIQNRGYDSAGICVNNMDFIVEKYASDDRTALSIMEPKLDMIRNKITDACSIIGHTRWATHGPKTDINAHPHIDHHNMVAVVHNGIIENYLELKNMLIKNGFTFKSQTDTEVISNLISYYYKNNNPEKAIMDALHKIEGTYALVITFKNHSNKLFCIRRGSPLLLSINNEYALISSERSGFCNNVTNYIKIENNDLCIIENKNNMIELNTYNNNCVHRKYTPIEIKDNIIETSPEPYPHWYIKEIMEQVESSLRSISMGGRLLDNNSVKLGGLEGHVNRLLTIDNMLLLGCGTSYHACLAGAHYFKDLCDFNMVIPYDGSEFTKKDIPKKGITGVIFVSQSGETKDLHRCIELCKDNDVIMIGVVNTPDSLIAREVDCGCYLNAGREVAVASTKAFTSMVIILSMIAIWFSQNKNINEHKRIEIINNLRKLYIDIKKTINNNIEKSKEIAEILVNNESLFILGKGICESSAREGSLKIKEVGYIHAEAYSSSALKHGPYSLLVKDFPVILICLDDEYYTRNIGISEEIKSRYGKCIVITDIININNHTFDNIITIEKNNSYKNILSVIPMQLIAYEIALLKGHNPDMLRNLAKCVTVD